MRSKFFSVMVVGDDPAALLKPYDMSLKVEPYVEYRFLDAEKMQKNAIKVLNALLENPKQCGLTEFQEQLFRERLKATAAMTPFDYYVSLTQGLYYDENGDAISDKNKNGKWETCREGRNFALPLLLKDGGESYSARKGDVDWDKMHLNNADVYKAAWEVCVEKRTPANKEEETIAQRMAGKENYFSNFETKDDYALYNTAYWNYAYVDEKGWKDINDVPTSMEWVISFYDNFVKPLDDDKLISIYECSGKEIKESEND